MEGESSFTAGLQEGILGSQGCDLGQERSNGRPLRKSAPCWGLLRYRAVERRREHLLPDHEAHRVCPWQASPPPLRPFT